MMGKKFKTWFMFLILFLSIFEMGFVHHAEAFIYDEYHINSTLDDVMFQRQANMYVETSTILTLQDPIYDSYVWLRWEDINCTLSRFANATLSIRTIERQSGTIHITINAINEVDCQAYNVNPMTRPIGSESIVWNYTATANGWQNVTVTDVIREVMDLYGWESGNDIGLRLICAFNSTAPDAFMYAWDYSSHQYAAKLYVCKYEDEDMPYNGGWDNSELNSTYPWGDVWEIWNGTVATRLVAGDLIWKPENTTSIDYTANTMGFSTGDFGRSHKAFSWYDSSNDRTVYMMARYETDANYRYHYLYFCNSTSLDTWTRDTDYLSRIATANAYDSFSYWVDSSGNVYYVWSESGSTTSVCKKYAYSTTKAITTLNSHTGASGERVTSMFVDDSTGDLYYYYMHSSGLAANRLYNSTDGGSVWNYESVTPASGNAYLGHADYLRDETGLRIVAFYEKGSETAMYCKVRSVSGVWGSEETPTGTHTVQYYAHSVAVSYWNEEGELGLAYLLHANASPFLLLDIAFVKRSNAGSWGGPNLIENTAFCVALNYNNEFYTGWSAFLVNNTDKTYGRIFKSDSGSGWSVSGGNYDTGASTLGNIQTLLNWDDESDHYFQIHYVNCTWTDPIPIPDFDPSDWEPVDPDDPEPPDWDNEHPMFSRFKMRLYMLVLGLFLICGSVFFMSTRPEETVYYVYAIFTMIVGLAFLMTITQI